ncbi:phosphatidate cytidylyltransferase [Rhodoferax saidenbachensis]|uniref:Phosphatidate cytidylyltransferase n=1 Tax=Rhodoferax saidenbachensis TaxID=1484693 RepID=A0A1P8K8K7_9BURK|nr:phosphatidate cytidylyltransferase [Rhodoferax saidenbachensis]APW42338.1 phosphatidate cytidylyltransferase [Rhodoferax saidenbachensis]
MLKQRVITALVLLGILLPAVFYPQPAAFAVVALVLIAAGAWEWARLNQYGATVAVSIGVLCAAMCAASWYGGVLYMQLKLVWIIAGSAWVLLGAWLLRGGSGTWLRVPRAVRLVGGVVALWVAWLAVIQARMVGINFLFSVLVLVWIADIFAYFAGRAMGGRFFVNKLAPSISPGKTWEGVCGGMVGVVVCAFVWRGLEGADMAGQISLYGRLSLVSTVFMVLAVLFLASMSVVGDLVESLFKRSAGVKDSSNLLPGHGGVLDRVDALLPILPLSMMLATL